MSSTLPRLRPPRTSASARALSPNTAPLRSTTISKVDRMDSTIAGHEQDLASSAAAALNHAAPDLSDLGMQRNRSKADTRQAVNLPSAPSPPLSLDS